MGAQKFYLENGRLVPGERAAPSPSVVTGPPATPPSLLGTRTLRIVEVSHEISKAGNAMVVIKARVISNDWANGFQLRGYFPYLVSDMAFERLLNLFSMLDSGSILDESDLETYETLRRLINLEFDAEVIPHSYEGRGGVVNTFKWVDERAGQLTLARQKKARERERARQAEAQELARERERLAELEAIMRAFVEMVREIVRLWADDVVDDSMLRFALLELS